MAPPYGWICGCYYHLPPPSKWSPAPKQYLAQVSTKAHTTILSHTSRTTLTQTFLNPSDTKAIKELSYSFPLYDGVSVVGFKCTIGTKVIEGVVREKEQARVEYKTAKEKGEVAGLLEQVPEASDVFITKLGNMPPGAVIVVDITYLGELKHDAEVDGVRFTIPSHIAPRYGDYPTSLSNSGTNTAVQKGFEVIIDAELEEGAYIRELRSPSHPIAVSLGTTSRCKNSDDPAPNKASATLTLSTAELSKDFILQLVAKETAIPKAMLETHPSIPNQRALMATLVPKFHLPPERPEIVFVCDRSGSMMGSKISSLRSALKVFLKSLPLGVKFNICSFGSSYSFLWSASKSYSQDSLDEAMRHVECFDANFGGTEMYKPMEESIKRRYKDMNLEIFLVTDGEIWDQQRLFDLLNEEVGRREAPIRVFTLGIGDAFSSSLIEGVARAGNGFSQAVGENEKLDGKVVRMLKAALSPHISDYTLEVRYADGKVDKTVDSLEVTLVDPSSSATEAKNPISLFETSTADTSTETETTPQAKDKFAHLPPITPPSLLQAPHKIPSLFPFSRTTVYLLLSPLSSQTPPLSVTLRATSHHGPLELEIPIQVLSKKGTTIHQLAARKAVGELEEGRGWLVNAWDAEGGVKLKEKFEGRFGEMVERECVRLGVQYQIAGKFCSFVAVEKKNESKEEKDAMDEDTEWEFLDEEVGKMNLADHNAPGEETTISQLRYAKSRKHKFRGIAQPILPPPLPPTKKKVASTTTTQAMSSPANESSNSLFGASPAPTAKLSRSNMMMRKSIPSGGLFGAAPSSSPMSSATYMPPQSHEGGAPMPSYGGGGNGLYGGAPGASAAMSFGAPAPPPAAAPARKAAGPPAWQNWGTGAVYETPPHTASHPPAPYSFVTDSITHGASMPLPDESDEQDLDQEIASPSYSPTSSTTSPIETSAFERSITRGENLPGYVDKSESQSSTPIRRQLASRAASKPLIDPLQALIDLQTFQGYWSLNEQLCAAVGVSGKEVEKVAKEKGLEGNWLATALAIRFLTLKLPEREESWELMVEKARLWLEMEVPEKLREIEGVAEGLIV